MVEVQFGEGGEDSKIFVHELLAVYTKYAVLQGFSCDLIHSDEGHAAIKVCGNGVWDAFKQEIGKHCVQRIPPTETRGRKQTSFVSVAVTPIPEEKSLKSLAESELRITFQKGHGKGGQHQNTTDSACRIVHPKSGIMVFINGRDQHANRRDAIRIITARVNELEQEKLHAEHNSMRKVLGKGGRGETEKIRTYNFLKSCAIDHRNGMKTSNVKGLMKGNLSLLM